MLPVSLDCPLLTAPLVFSNVDIYIIYVIHAIVASRVHDENVEYLLSVWEYWYALLRPCVITEFLIWVKHLSTGFLILWTLHTGSTSGAGTAYHPKHTSPLSVLVEIPLCWIVRFLCSVWRTNFVFSCLAIVLSVLRITCSDYAFGTFKPKFS